MITKNFNCTQYELYAVCHLGWESCNQNIEQFTALKKRYNLQFIADRQAEIQTVASMPDHYQRRAEQELLRQEMKNELQDVLKTWKKLKRFIVEAWPKGKQNVSLVSAGLPYYKEAYNMKWEAVYSLMNNGDRFIKKHQERLKLGNNMSDEFVLEFEAKFKDYTQMYYTYLDAGKLSQNDTELLTKAQNKLYNDLILMFGDAKTVFMGDANMQRQFVFDNVLTQVSGSNMAGLKGVVTNGAIPAVEIPEIKLTIKELGESIGTDEDGRYFFSPLAAGFYTLEVEAPGYKKQSIANVEVKTSTVATLNIHLESI